MNWYIDFIMQLLEGKFIASCSSQPTSLVSSTLVLQEQEGNCFDYAMLLASLLIGVGYDAYCVCGYASQDVCLLNLGRNTCPTLQEKKEVVAVTKPSWQFEFVFRSSGYRVRDIMGYQMSAHNKWSDPCNNCHYPNIVRDFFFTGLVRINFTIMDSPVIQVVDEEVEVKQNRYKVRSLRDFSSGFEKRQLAKEKAKRELDERKKKEEEAIRIAVRIIL